MKAPLAPQAAQLVDDRRLVIPEWLTYFQNVVRFAQPSADFGEFRFFVDPADGALKVEGPAGTITTIAVP